eukprot:TRINITY_DN1594_c0_g1_i2.p1 TRINITY_DN1594_c0_g1~~TRINITY_DN1594_c0_g1_i2.p1  ORF type:complete len:2278 (+),score=582.51 TRINITY_DN1594_c0_g1_i2:35-6835(+)
MGTESELATPASMSGGSSSSRPGCQDGRQTERLLIQVKPQDWPVDALGPCKDGYYWRHCFWLRRHAPWQKLAAAWAREHGCRPEVLRLLDLSGQELLLHETPALHGLQGDCGKAEGSQPTSLVLAPRQDVPGAAEAWAGALEHGKRQVAPLVDEEAAASRLQLVRVTAAAEGDVAAALQFRVSSEVPLRKLMVAWCARQGLSLSEVQFSMGSGQKLQPTDELRKICNSQDSKEAVDIIAEPCMTPGPGAAPQVAESSSIPAAAQAAVPAAPVPPAASATPAANASSSKPARVQVRVAAQGELLRQLPSTKMKTAQQSHGGLSFWTKMFAPLGKVTAAWCKHFGLQRKDVLLVCEGKEVGSEETAASRGWTSGQEVTFEAALKTDMVTRKRLLQADQTSNEAGDVANDERALIRVLDGDGDTGTSAPVEFRMRASTTFERMMNAWREQRGLTPEKPVRFELLPGARTIKAGDLAADDTPGTRGWSVGSGPLTVRAIPGEVALRGPGAAKIDVQVVALQENSESAKSVDFKIGLATPLRNMMHAWCQHNSIPESAATFSLSGRLLKPEDSLESLGLSGAPKPVIIHAGMAAAGSAKTERNAADNSEKINVQVVAKEEEGENVVDFKMKLSTPFEKMMEAWCKHHNLKQDEAVFEFQGRELRRDDTPSSCSWSVSKGTLRVEAKPREEVSATPMKREDAPAKITADDEDKLQVQVVAHDDGGEHVIDFKMRLNMPFEKMMKAWCEQCNVDMCEAVFELEGQELTPTQTPGSCGWSKQKGLLRVSAKPREGRSQKQSPTASSDGVEQDAKISVNVVAWGEDGENVLDFKMKLSTSFEKVIAAWCKHHGVHQSEAVFQFRGQELRPQDTPACLGWSQTMGVLRIEAMPKEEGVATQNAEASASEDAQEKIDLQVVAMGNEGRSVIDFKMKLNTPFEKMMKAWCKHNDIDEGAAEFQFEGRVLQPDDTPGRCQWSRSKGTLIIEAKPREAPTVVTSTADKITVQVIAKGDNGENVVDVRMKLDTQFDKMMKAWCKHQGIHQSEAVFSFEGKTLKPEDSPNTCAWSISKGILRVEAKPKDEQVNVSSEGIARASAAAAVEEKIEVKVVAIDDDGETVVDFKMKSTTQFEKMMKAWCQHHGVDLAEAVFSFEGRELKPEDSPNTCKWSASKGVLRVEAKPREEEIQAPTTTKTQEAADSRVGSASEAANKHDSPISPSSQVSASASAAFPPDANAEKIEVKVVAMDDDGEHVSDFKMKPSTRFDKMMKAWCKANGVNLSEASFWLGGKELKPEDSPSSCQWSSSNGILRIEAKPKEENSPIPPEPVGESHVESGTASATETTCKEDSATIPGTLGAMESISAPVLGEEKTKESISRENVDAKTLTPDLPSQGAPAPASTPAEEKVTVQVIAQGEEGDNVVDFKMKLSTPFEKMMKAWCQHHGIPLSEAVFEYQGQELKAEDNPAKCEWSPSKGTLRIQARPKDEDTRDRAPTVPHHKSPEGSVVPKEAAPLETSCAVPAKSVEEKIEVRVIADGTQGQNVTNVKMKLSTPFEKMMAAWCKQYDISRSAVRFELESKGGLMAAGQELLGKNSPASCGWSAEKGSLVVRAVPRDEAEPKAAEEAVKEQAAPIEAADVPKEQAAPAPKAAVEVPKVQARSPAQEAPGSVESTSQAVGSEASDATSVIETGASQINEQSGDDKIMVEVHADSEDGKDVLSFKMKRASTFAKMMKAWCSHHNIPLEGVRFLHKNAAIAPGQTPQALGTTNASLVISAVPRGADVPEPEETESQVSAEQQKASVSDSQASSAIPQIDVQVVADGQNGPNILHFKMKLTTTFGKMMARWCSHHNVPQDEASFYVGEHMLKAEDTPGSVGIVNPKSEDVLTVKAQPRGAPPPSTAEPATKRAGRGKGRGRGGSGRGPKRQRISEQEQVPATSSAAKQSVADTNRSVSLLVQAHGSDGLSEVRFNVHMSTPMSKMMKAWCDQHEIPLEEAAFLKDNVVLKPEDTAASLGHDAGDLILQAVPRDQVPESSSSQAPTAASSKGSSEQVLGSVDAPPKRGAAAKRAASRKLAGSRDPPRSQKRRKRNGNSSNEDEAEDEKAADAAVEESLRRSQRIRESPGPQGLAAVTLIHHPPTPTSRRQNQSKDVPVETKGNMTFREYLEFDRQQDKLREQARLERQKRKLVNGDSSDEELQMAMALSLSESQIACDSQPDGQTEHVPGASSQVAASQEPAVSSKEAFATEQQPAAASSKDDADAPETSPELARVDEQTADAS